MNRKQRRANVPWRAELRHRASRLGFAVQSLNNSMSSAAARDCSKSKDPSPCVRNLSISRLRTSTTRATRPTSRDRS
jgi:hypothetical protein